MKREVKPILVTGSHRSGTTWAGKMLAVAPGTAYIFEPFNPKTKFGVTSGEFKYWFKYVGEENSLSYKTVIDNVIRYKYPLNNNIAKIKTVRNVVEVLRDQGLFFFYKLRNNTPIIKDPIAIFSSEWLSKNFDMNVLIMIRHPAAFCSSLKIKNWMFEFKNFLEQPLLMKKYLGKFENEIRDYTENPKNIIEQAILLWKCIYHTVNMYQENHPEWMFVRHEDLSLDSVNQFRLIYKAFGLEFTHRSKSAILKSSGHHNPCHRCLTHGQTKGHYPCRR